MEPILADFEKIAGQIRFSAPQIPLVSNVTGEVATDEHRIPTYWCRHLRGPVRFAAGMESIARLGVETFVEIAPKPVLLGMGRGCLADARGAWLPSHRPETEDWQQLLNRLGALYRQSIPINWVGFDRDYARHRIGLPTYPFQRRSYWIEAPEW